MDYTLHKKFEHRRNHIYSSALLEVVDMVETMRPDDLLIGAIYRHLARAVCLAYDMPPPGTDPGPLEPVPDGF
jgi:hypothetical protein